MKRLAMWTMILACMAVGCVKARTLRYYTLSIPPTAIRAEAQQIPVTVLLRENLPLTD